MKSEGTQKITITLPHAVYHQLRNEAQRQGVSLPEFIKQKVHLKPSQASPLANLPVQKILEITAPDFRHPDERIDFFS